MFSDLDWAKLLCNKLKMYKCSRATKLWEFYVERSLSVLMINRCINDFDMIR